MKAFMALASLCALLGLAPQAQAYTRVDFQSEVDIHRTANGAQYLYFRVKNEEIPLKGLWLRLDQNQKLTGFRMDWAPLPTNTKPILYSRRLPDSVMKINSLHGNTARTDILLSEITRPSHLDFQFLATKEIIAKLPSRVTSEQKEELHNRWQHHFFSYTEADSVVPQTLLTQAASEKHSLKADALLRSLVQTSASLSENQAQFNAKALQDIQDRLSLVAQYYELFGSGRQMGRNTLILEDVPRQRLPDQKLYWPRYLEDLEISSRGQSQSVFAAENFRSGSPASLIDFRRTE